MEKKHQCKHCNYYYYCSVTGSTTITCTTAFFHISILSTDLILVGEQQLLSDYKLKGSGWGGAEHLLNGIFCTFSWIVLSFGYEEVVDGEGSKPRTSPRRSVTREDLKRRKLRLLQKISEDRETMQKTLWALIVFHNFLSDQSIHLKKDFFYQIYW